MIYIIYIIIVIPLQLVLADLPICIVGGGVTGLRTAKLLQDKGHNVSLFEAKSNYGGKMETFRSKDNSVVLDKGTLIVLPGQSRFRALIKHYGLTENPAGFQNRSAFDPFTGVVRELPYLSPDHLKQVMEACMKYAKIHNQRNHLLHLSYNHPELENSDLTKPSLDWLVDNSLQTLIPFLMIMTTAGYGALEETPALYMLQYFNPNFFDLGNPSLESQFHTTNEGFDLFVQGMADEVKSKHLNHEVVRIEKSFSTEKVILHFKGKHTKPQECSKVIFAFPPLLSTLINIIDDLSQEEAKILRQIKVSKYTSAGISITEWENHDAVVYSGILNSLTGRVSAPTGRGEVAAIIRSSKGTRNDTFMAYSWIRGEYDSGPTESELKLMDNQLKTLMKEIEQNSRKLPIKKNEIFYGPQGYNYFPRVSGESIKNGFYRKFKSLQGKGGVYFATPLLTFELMEPLLEMVEDFVQEYF